MSRVDRDRITPKMVWTYALFAACAWTLLIGGAVYIQYRLFLESAREHATVSARSQFFKDVVYRRWNANLGGVYAEVTDELEPNPYLTQVEEREITSTSGRTFTLINPAFMTRQVHEIARETERIQGHITSLDPIRPENAPDEWETAALRSFDDVGDEVAEVQVVDGSPYLRLMKPLITEAGCLACHAFQGYREGEVRGGISVSVPMEEYLALEQAKFGPFLTGIGLIWLVGLGGIGLGGWSVSSRVAKQLQAERRVEDLLAGRELMFREVQHRIKNNMYSMAAILSLKADGMSDPEGRRAMEDMSRRFEIMMSLYQRLYSSPDASVHSMPEYLTDIARQILVSTGAEDVSLSVDLAELDLPPETLAALGIITVEAMTNSIKYAFHGGNGGTIHLSSRIDAERGRRHLHVRIADNGSGDAPGATSVAEADEGLGITLMKSLAAQLGGSFSLEYSAGTTVYVDFPLSA